MKTPGWSVLLFLAAMSLTAMSQVRAGGGKGLTAVPFQDVHVADRFWGPRIATNRKATVESNLHECEITGRIKNFAVCGKLVPGKHRGLLFNDSDVYKVIEGIA